jgi:hypothetical protein
MSEMPVHRDLIDGLARLVQVGDRLPEGLQCQVGEVLAPDDRKELDAAAGLVVRRAEDGGLREVRVHVRTVVSAFRRCGDGRRRISVVPVVGRCRDRQ